MRSDVYKPIIYGNYCTVAFLISQREKNVCWIASILAKKMISGMGRGVGNSSWRILGTCLLDWSSYWMYAICESGCSLGQKPCIAFCAYTRSIKHTQSHGAPIPNYSISGRSEGYLNARTNESVTNLINWLTDQLSYRIAERESLERGNGSRWRGGVCKTALWVTDGWDSFLINSHGYNATLKCLAPLEECGFLGVAKA